MDGVRQGDNLQTQTEGSTPTGNPQNIGLPSLQQPTAQNNLQGAAPLSLLGNGHSLQVAGTRGVKSATTQTGTHPPEPRINSHGTPAALYAIVVLTVVIFVVGLTYGLFRERSYERS